MGSAMSVKEDLRSPMQQPSYRKLIPILSIDGGGVRGIIAAVILDFLETELQKLDGENARLADYFDVIVGTSTGGIVAAMLTTPNEEGRPAFLAKDVKDFYLKHCPKIFSHDSSSNFHKELHHLFEKVANPVSKAKKLIKTLLHPKHNGKHLRMIIEDKLKQKKISEALTNVVITTFDIKAMQPVIFSRYESRRNPDLNAKVSDICIGTSVAPIYLPAHKFHTKDSNGGNLREFNLIDGAVIANNPVLVALSEVTKEIADGGTFPIKSMEVGRFLVLSLGTGSQKFRPKYDATKSSNWGALRWLVSGSSTPLIDVFTQASGDIVDYHLSTIFQAFHSEENYLRIQDDTLSGDLATLDLATPENLENLVKVGEKLLKKQVSRVNLHTGIFEPCRDSTTNEKALEKFATILHKQKKVRKLTYPNTNR